MARGIRVPFIADVREFIAGTRRAEQSLEDFEDSLESVVREGDSATNALEADFRDLANSADRSFDKIDRSADDALGTKLKGKGKRVGGEIGEEFSQNFGEAIRGGNIGDALVETVTSLGPALGAAGLAAAAAFGIGKALLDEASKAQKRAKQVGSNLFEAFRDGILEAKEREGILTGALGVDDIAAATARAADIARRLGVETSDALTYILTAGKTATPELEAALARAAAEAAAIAADADATGEGVSASTLAAEQLRDAAKAAGSGLETAATNAGALELALARSSGSATVTAEQTQAIAAYAKIAAGYWSDIERSVVRAGTAVPGQVRAERQLPR